MKAINQYLQKQENTGKYVSSPPTSDLGIIVVIPAYKEPEISRTILSLLDCDLPNCSVEVLVFVNGSSSDEATVVKANESCYRQCQRLVEENIDHQIRIHVFKDLAIPAKKSGVGRARKILMDEALLRFKRIENSNGVIVNLDADCTVAKNYLTAIENKLIAQQTHGAATIFFEHSLDNDAILQYELHLRYFIGMQKVLGFPFAFQTVGSCMAVRALDYAKIGGMNTRKAGEDFYFLHKLIKNNRCVEINHTTVFPSGRISDRVPFGTGKAVNDIGKVPEMDTYHPGAFYELLPLISGVETLWSNQRPSLSGILKDYLVDRKFFVKVENIRKHSTSQESFRNKYFQYFDAFLFMKSLHFLREEQFHSLPLSIALEQYFLLIGLPFSGISESSLQTLRNYDRTYMINEEQV